MEEKMKERYRTLSAVMLMLMRENNGVEEILLQKRKNIFYACSVVVCLDVDFDFRFIETDKRMGKSRGLAGGIHGWIGNISPNLYWSDNRKLFAKLFCAIRLFCRCCFDSNYNVFGFYFFVRNFDGETIEKRPGFLKEVCL